MPEVFKHTVCSHFLPAIINGDESGLEEDECQAIKDWYEREGFDLRYGHFSPPNGENYYGDCEIVGMKGDVADFEWVQMRNPPK